MTDRVPNFRLWAKPAAAKQRAASDEVVPHDEHASEEMKEPTLPHFHLAWEQHPHEGPKENKVPHKSNHNPEPNVPKFHKWF